MRGITTIWVRATRAHIWVQIRARFARRVLWGVAGISSACAVLIAAPAAAFALGHPRFVAAVVPDVEGQAVSEPPGPVRYLDDRPAHLACGSISVVYDRSGAPAEFEPAALSRTVMVAIHNWSSAIGRDVAVGQDPYHPTGTVITIDWVEDLPGDVVGLGGSSIVYKDRSPFPTITGGTITLAADGDLALGGGRASWGEVVEHEAGHVARLAHAPAPGARMTTPSGSSTVYTADEVAALRWVGDNPVCNRSTNTPTTKKGHQK
jgi:hypothetical protein